MEIIRHTINHIEIAEVVSSEIIIDTVGDGIELLGNLYYQEYDSIIMYQKNITADFFNLRTGIAGEILQKFSNYRVRLAIVGDFTQFSGKSMNDFLVESNRGGQINFVSSLQDALDRLATS